MGDRWGGLSLAKGMWALAMVFILVLGCGPKGPSQEQLDELNRVRESALAAEQKLTEVQREKQQCEVEKSSKTEQRDRLQAELEDIKQKLGGGM